MKFKSTRDRSPLLGFSDALKNGLALDGGLYVPEKFPHLDLKDFSNTPTLVDCARKIMTPFLQGDVLEKNISDIVSRAFNFPVPLVTLQGSGSGTTSVLELFHGPTAAFKDVGARFLAQCLRYLVRSGTGKKWTVLVATSGDTGGAVAAAFHGTPDINIAILYPKGLVSPFQEKQLTCWGGNIHAFAVSGSFDDCQKMVKEGFGNPEFRKNRNLLSANSINIGRILPQTVYYAVSSLLFFQKYGRKPGFIVPSGNLGNSLAALWARKMGFPIGKVVLACNANRAVPDYFETGQWEPKPTVATLANAMDVGNASNMERLVHLYPDLKNLNEDASAFSVSDSEIKQIIKSGEKNWSRIWCPHTATAVDVREKLAGGDWIIVSTAHPAKFQEIVEPLVGKPVPLPPSLGQILSRPIQMEMINPSLHDLNESMVLLGL